jgi:hypothetical protein
MQTKTFGLLASSVLLALAATAYAEDDKDEMVVNPKYKFWANQKPGATSVYHEETKFSGTDKDSVPGAKDVKKIAYKLLSVSKDKVVVQTTVTEEEQLGWVEHAPTKLIYHAKIKKSTLDAVFEEFGVKEEPKDATVTIGKNEIKCKMLSGTQKKSDAVITYQLYFSESVPGGIVKRVRVSKSGDKFTAETTIMLESFTLGKEKKEKDKKDKEEKKAKPKEEK